MHSVHACDSISLDQLGYQPFFSQQGAALGTSVEPARVVGGAHGILDVIAATGPRRATLGGRLLHEATIHGRASRPTVGDWVGLRPEADVVVHLFERRTCLRRLAAGERIEAQVLAANVDTLLIVTSLNADFNPRRLERYLEMALTAGVRPVFVLNKADLCESASSFVAATTSVAAGATVVPVSALAGSGLDAVRAEVRAGETLALVGSSGVGKSTLANRLLGRAALAEGALRDSDDRGRHTTTHRELFVLPGGGVIVDTPGLRELQPWSEDERGPSGFGDVEALAAACRFRDCAHDGEPGCAVTRAVEEGGLLRERLASFTKLSGAGRALRDGQDVRARRESKRQLKLMTREVRKHPKR